MSGHAIERVGVVGLGTMGAGIAEVCARSGVPTVGVEPTAALAARGRDALERSLARGVERGKVEPGARDAALELFSTTTDIGELSGCDLVIEAVLEEPAIKEQVFGELDRAVAPSAILATNTSALSVTRIAAASERPERVVGLHFFNPAPVLRLVEVVRTELVAEAVVDAAAGFVRRIGKEPVVCGDTPGFVVNRILIPLLNDAVRALEEGGATPEDVDRAMTLGASWPIGPLALIDLVGVDVQVHASEALYEAFREPRFAPPPRLVRMVEAGRLGRKTGQGFFRY